MKNLIAITLLFMCSNFGILNSQFIFSEFDQQAIQLMDCIDRNCSELTIHKDQFSEEWLKVKERILNHHYDHLDNERFVKYIDPFVRKANAVSYTEGSKESKVYLFKILNSFSEIRDWNCNESYPLDIVLNLLRNYDEFHVIIHDPLFDLREWKEFEFSIAHFQSTLELYENIEPEVIHSFNYHLDIDVHRLQIEKIKSCLADLKLATESGYQKTFEMPCDNLGNSLEELLMLYSKEENLVD